MCKVWICMIVSEPIARIHIAQNIAKKCQKYFQYFIAIEIFSQHFFSNIAQYFIATLQH